MNSKMFSNYRVHTNSFVHVECVLKRSLNLLIKKRLKFQQLFNAFVELVSKQEKERWQWEHQKKL
jgi:hypothetical protein